MLVRPWEASTNGNLLAFPLGVSQWRSRMSPIIPDASAAKSAPTPVAETRLTRTPRICECTIPRASMRAASSTLAVLGTSSRPSSVALTIARRSSSAADIASLPRRFGSRPPRRSNRMSEGIASPPIPRRAAIWPGSERRMPRMSDFVLQGVHARYPLWSSMSSPRL